MNKVYNWESKMFDQICMFKVIIHPMGFPGGSDGKESTCNAGDLGSIPGSGRSLAEGNGIHSSILAWRIPWAEKPSGLQPMGLQSQTQLRD